MTSLTKLMKSSGCDQNTITRISLFVLLNVIDVVSTILLTQSGLGREVNLLLSGSPYQLVVIKGLLMFLVLRYWGRQYRIMNALNIGMMLVISWNLFWLVVL